MSYSLRSKVDFDYKVYNETGEKVPKYRESKMDADLAKQAINIYSDVEDFFESYDLEIMSSFEDIEKYDENIRVLKQEFRRLRHHLKISDEEKFYSSD